MAATAILEASNSSLQKPFGFFGGSCWAQTKPEDKPNPLSTNYTKQLSNTQLEAAFTSQPL